MKQMLGILTGLVLTYGYSAGVGAAPVYKCMVAGQVRFQNEPCRDATQRDAGRIDGTPMLAIGKNNSAGGPSAAPGTAPIGGGSEKRRRRVITETPLRSQIDQCLGIFQQTAKQSAGAFAAKAQLQEVTDFTSAGPLVWTEVALLMDSGSGRQMFFCAINADGSINQERTEPYGMLVR